MNVKKQNESILIADDHPQSLEMIATGLSRYYKVYRAIDGEDALVQAKKLNPDLILLDVWMPKFDGYEVCQLLRQQERFTHTPILLISAEMGVDNMVHGFDLGAVDFICKPVNLPELHSRVRTHLALKHSHDVIEHQNQLLHEKNEKLDEVIAEQRELLHVLCHDLINPFSAIIGLGQLIKDEPELAHRLLDPMIASAKNGFETIGLIRRMRDLDEFKLPLETICLNDAINESKAMLMHRFDIKEVTFKSDMPEDMWVVAETRSLINSVLSNIFTNALKFSYPNSTIHYTAEQAQSQIKLTIQDDGIGIPEKIVKNLFDIKARNHRPGTLGESGTGFGMPLVKKFMDSYGGRVEVSSICEKQNNASHGTTFTLYFKQA